MTAPLFPLGLFGLEDVGPPKLVRRALSGGVSLSGEEQKVGITGGGSWVLQASGDLIEENKVRAWRALETLLAGGTTAATVEWPVGLFQPIGPLRTRRPFGWPPVAASGILQAQATAFGVHALRATTLNIADFSAPRALVGGEFFTIDHATWGERGYEIAEVVSQAQVKIRPPLREALVGDEVIDFDNPRCLMKVADMQTQLNMGRFAKVSVSLVESREKP
jgi:hypothetical protein